MKFLFLKVGHFFANMFIKLRFYVEFLFHYGFKFVFKPLFLCLFGLNCIKSTIRSLYKSLKNIIRKLIDHHEDCFQLANSLSQLMNKSKWFFVTSIGFDQIFFETKNSTRFQICVFSCVYCWLVVIGQLIFVSFNKIYFRFDGPFIPDHFRTFYILVVLTLVLGSWLKTELLFGEKNYNLKPLRVFYYLINNYKHNLNAENYRKLSYLTKISQTFVVNFGTPIVIIFGTFMMSKIAFLSGHLFWFLQVIHLIPSLMLGSYALSIVAVIFVIYFYYYKFIFKQINVKFKEIIPNENLRYIFGRREKKLINLMQEHHDMSIEIYKLNLIARRIAAAKFIAVSFVNIFSLYFLIYLKISFLIRLIQANIFVCFIMSSFTLNFFFSRQIKSAHQIDKFVYSIVCKCKISLNLRMQLYNFIQRLSGPPIGLYCYNIAPCHINTFCNVILSFLTISY